MFSLPPHSNFLLCLQCYNYTSSSFHTFICFPFHTYILAYCCACVCNVTITHPHHFILLYVSHFILIYFHTVVSAMLQLHILILISYFDMFPISYFYSFILTSSHHDDDQVQLDRLPREDDGPITRAAQVSHHHHHHHHHHHYNHHHHHHHHHHYDDYSCTSHYFRSVINHFHISQ